MSGQKCGDCNHWRRCQDEPTDGECRESGPCITLRPETGRHHRRGGWLRTPEAEDACGKFQARPEQHEADPIEATLETNPVPATAPAAPTPPTGQRPTAPKGKGNGKA